MSQPDPLISVVINTCNRAPHLGNALRGLMGLRRTDFEVVVVNGPSTDGTEAVLAEWAGRIRRADCPEMNLSISRNIGIAAATGEIVAFLDDDAVPHPDWLDRLAEPYREPRVGAVGGFTVDNTGMRWQVRKTVCDRYGNAHLVSDHFDERPLNRPGTPFYPSLLGTNASYRMAALREVGGFDHAYAYLLDETDLCLRLVDAGWQVVYEPAALIFHQFAPSHIRGPKRIARTLYPSAVSKAYFIARHGATRNRSRAAGEIERYQREIADANAWLEEHREIDAAHRASLDQDLAWGIRDGEALARRRGDRPGGDLGAVATTAPAAAAQRFPTDGGLTIAMATQGFPPEGDAGIARWTAMVARELARRGHRMHVLTRAGGEAPAESLRFEEGIWVHRLLPEAEGAEAVMLAHGLPPNIAAWNRRIWRAVQGLKDGFGLDVLSFPIWDLEGLACLGDPAIGVVMSLHTSYAMAKPHKPEWTARPLYEHFMVRRMIAAEARALATAPLLLANSRAVVADCEAAYGLPLDPARVILAPHGTEDLLAGHGAEAAAPDAPYRVLFVGRFEPRKGFDLAAAAARRLLEAMPGRVELRFAGGTLDAGATAALSDAGAVGLPAHPDVRFLGVLDRPALEAAYRACDVVMVPSRYESFGLVAIEAMAAGKPVVALAAGGLAEVVTEGVDGLLVPDGPEAAERLAEALLRLGRDPAERRRLAAGARRSFEERYTIPAMVDAVEPAYRRAAAMAAAGGAAGRRAA